MFRLCHYKVPDNTYIRIAAHCMSGLLFLLLCVNSTVVESWIAIAQQIWKDRGLNMTLKLRFLVVILLPWQWTCSSSTPTLTPLTSLTISKQAHITYIHTVTNSSCYSVYIALCPHKPDLSDTIITWSWGDRLCKCVYPCVSVLTAHMVTQCTLFSPAANNGMAV